MNRSRIFLESVYKELLVKIEDQLIDVFKVSSNIIDKIMDDKNTIEFIKERSKPFNRRSPYIIAIEMISYGLVPGFSKMVPVSRNTWNMTAEDNNYFIRATQNNRVRLMYRRDTKKLIGVSVDFDNWHYLAS